MLSHNRRGTASGATLSIRLALATMLCYTALASSAIAKRAHEPQSPAPQNAAFAGKRFFATACASCHGLDGQGGERAPNILLRPELQHMSDADIARVIREGTPSKRMPAFGDSLDVATIRNLTAYVRTLLRTGRQNIKLPGDAVNGKALFFDKGACSQCHMVDGKGGFFGADLSVYARSHSIEDIRNAIVNPDKFPERRQKTITVVTGDGQQFTGIARNEDNFSIQLQTPDGAFHLLMKSDVAQLKEDPHSLMPGDYSQRLTTRELDDLISFLIRASLNSKDTATPSQKDAKHNR